MTRARQWSVLTAVACLAVMAAGWFILVKPQRTHASSLRDQATQVTQTNETLQAQIAHLRQQAKDLPAQQRKLAAIARKVPDSPSLPSLIRQLSAAADGAGVNLIALAPGQPALVVASGATTTAVKPGATAATTSPSTSAPAPAPAASATLASIPLQIQVQGSYFNLEQFFAAVEGLQRAMMVTQFNAAPAASGAATAGTNAVAPGTLNATLSATVFMSPNATVAGATTTTGK
jgi:Tfp pilus assembly protein PilO